MANTDEIFSDSFENNAPSEVDTHSAYLSIETETDAGSTSISHTMKTSRLTFSIHKHCRTVTKDEKECMRANVF